MMRRVVACAAALFLASAVLAGCDSEDKKNYDVPITWNIAGSQGATCAGTLNGPPGAELVEFDNVEIAVYSEEGEPIQQAVEVSCADYAYTIPRLKRGNYIVELGAMTDFDGDYLPYYQAELPIKAPAKEDYEAVLLQGDGEIAVSWSFDNSMMCGPNEVTEVEISLYDGDETILCEDGLFLIEDLGWSTYDVTVVGLDESGEETWTGDCDDNPFEVKPGQTFEAHVVLSEI